MMIHLGQRERVVEARLFGATHILTAVNGEAPMARVTYRGRVMQSRMKRRATVAL